MPYGPGAKAEVLSILAFRAYPVNRGFATGGVEVTENRFSGTSIYELRSSVVCMRPCPGHLLKRVQ